MKVIERRNIWFAISLIVFAAGVISFIVQGFNFDIEFAGGTMLQIDMHTVLEDTEELEAVIQEATGDSNPQIQAVSGSGSETQFSIKVTEQSPDQIDALYQAIAQAYNLDTETNADLIQTSSISPTISSEMQRSAILSTAIAGVLILLYITFRFRDICFGLGALIPLIHDVLIVVAVYTIFQIPLNNTFIVAILTIVGYSINNTIVVFDRIRENRKFYKKSELATLADVSIKQTLGRSLATSFTTIITVFLLFILGVQSLQWFALPLLVGILAGTYSSLFIASPIWYLLERKIHR